MTKVNLPGFSAEASLYRTARYYQLTGVLATDIVGRLSFRV
jgi:hypothetical protein